MRALIAAKAAGCDLINLSYGEPFYQADAGRVSQTFNDAVRKWGMAVSRRRATTARRSPPWSARPSECAHHGWRIHFTSHDGRAVLDAASDFSDEEPALRRTPFPRAGPHPTAGCRRSAHPAARSPRTAPYAAGQGAVPRNLDGVPSACGVAAVVLSALRQSGAAIGPIELRRALENSALPVETQDPFAQGHGLIHAPAAIAYATEHHGKPGQDVEFCVSVPSRANARGIYLRDPVQMGGPLTFGVHVRPLLSTQTHARLPSSTRCSASRLTLSSSPMPHGL